MSDTTIRVRPTRITVQIEAVIDDGDTLRPVSTAPMGIAAADWSQFDLDTAVSELQEQIESTDSLSN